MAFKIVCFNCNAELNPEVRRTVDFIDISAEKVEETLNGNIVIECSNCGNVATIDGVSPVVDPTE